MDFTNGKGDKMKLDFLKEHYSKYSIEFASNGEFAAIINPFSDEHIKVEYYVDDEYTPYITRFSFQHCHLTDEESVVEWIDDIINCRRYAIEFFRNGKNCFGGDIEADELIDLTYEKLERYIGYWGITKLYEAADCFKVRGWDKYNNFDGKFNSNSEGETVIEILKNI